MGWSGSVCRQDLPCPSDFVWLIWPLTLVYPPTRSPRHPATSLLQQRSVSENSLVAMDFSGRTGRVIDNPIEAQSAALEEGQTWRVSWGLKPGLKLLTTWIFGMCSLKCLPFQKEIFPCHCRIVPPHVGMSGSSLVKNYMLIEYRK